jgi:hypothetical protein
MSLRLALDLRLRAREERFERGRAHLRPNMRPSRSRGEP